MALGQSNHHEHIDRDDQDKTTIAQYKYNLIPHKNDKNTQEY